MSKVTVNQDNAILAEQSVIGSLILDNDVYDRIGEMLRAEDFFHPANQILYQHIQQLAESGQVYDVVTLETSLAKARLIDQVGGIGYLAEIANNTPTTTNVVAYAEIVRKKSITRKLSKSLLEANELLKEKGLSEEETLEKIEQSILSVRQSIETGESEFISAKAVIPEIIDYLDALSEKGDGLAGLPTGFIDLDDKLCGLKEEQLIIVAGRPAMGKTTFAMNIAEAVLRKTDQSVLVFSMEMSAKDIMMRMASSLGKLPFSTIRSGQLEDEDWPKLTAAFTEVEKMQLSIVDRAALTPLELKHKARKFKRENPNLGLIVIDYLQLMQSPGFQNNRNLEITYISSQLKALAKELKIPVIALSQLNRGLESRANKKPLMSDLRDSGSIEQDADVILFVHREEVYNRDDPDLEGEADIVIGKQRNGEIGEVQLTFRGEYCQFANREFRQYERQFG
ncbi:replicative DNA helicase [Fangia hongkongensis]|uniref:replicative DNA helicase n=1 Tax=Fangia hongkongensis TaxID=270495 RepID=UPI00036BD2BF|nr:replicative DNA helicase [Fangia hongkongensis]MBK2124744.1 replicative DNA helicase [Fangia hongkongensis]